MLVVFEDSEIVTRVGRHGDEPTIACRGTCYRSSAMPSAAKLFAELATPQRKVATKLHEALMKIQPKYEAGPKWNGIAYALGKNNSCMIVGYGDHVKLMIWRGKDLDDADGLLEGTGSNSRHVRYATEKDVKITALRRLLKQQFSMYAAGESAERRPARGEKSGSRPRHRMPAEVRAALRERDLLKAYQARPPYQRNDYLGWIAQAKRPETKKRRLDLMLDELERGDRYMKMPYKARN